MHFPFLLLMMALTCEAAYVVHDVSDCQDSSSLCDRLGQVERLLTGQSRLLSQQHHLLRQLQSKLSHQEDQLQQLDEKLSHQEDLNLQQAEQLLFQQNLLQRQDEQLSEQERLLRQQAAKLTQQDLLFRQQELKLSQKTSSVQLLEAEKARDSAELKTVKERLDSVLVNTDCDDTRDGLSMKPSLSDSNDSVVSTTRNVMPRSDDQGPLEVVVSHMGQQLTEMSADIQALKNSDQVLKTYTDTQVQTLKTQSDTQIQMLKDSDQVLKTYTDTQIQALKDSDQGLKNTNTQQDQAIQDAQTSTFIHWGSSQCSNASQLVYSGVVGGSLYTQSGAATNYLCLTMSPVPSDHGFPSLVAHLYGGEYDTGDSHQSKDPACAVCRSSQSTIIMIPGTNVCTPGWHQHYNGFLMAGYHGHTVGSEFICVDSRLESCPGSSDDHNGKLLNYAVTSCGSLPCDPYVNNKVVTYVVCSK